MANEPKTHWVEVRVKMREAEVKELQPGDQVWYFIKKYLIKERLNPPDAHGPFRVAEVEPFRLTNTSNITLKLNPELLVLLVPCEGGH